MTPNDIRFPFANVMRALPEHFDTAMNERNGKADRTIDSFLACVNTLKGVNYSRSTIARWMAGQPLTNISADRVAVANGMHPAQIWPEEWGQYMELCYAFYDKKARGF